MTRLSFLTGGMTALGVVTGPLQARALGASGRGELAAITVVGALLPIVAGLGLEAFTTREIARGALAGEVMGTVGLVSLVIGVLVAPLGIPLSALLAHGRHTVHVFILVEFLLLPLALVLQLQYYLLLAWERWTAVVVYRVMPVLIPGVAIIILFVTSSMTVPTVAIVTIATGVLAGVAGISALRSVGRLRFRPSLLRRALPFGLKTWVGTIAVFTNGRLDQLIMIGLVSSRQLGLYAVAVTGASLSNQVAYSLGSPLLSRVAAGERHLVSRSLRMTLGFVFAVNLAMAAVTPVLLPLLFGSAFRDAVPMTLILLIAALPLCVTSVLSTAMVADGQPSIPAIAEGLTVLITVPGLLLLLPSLGGIGAALVSLIAYSANAAFQLRSARSNFGDSVRNFILPGRADAVWARHRVKGVLSKLASRGQAIARD